MSCSHLLLYLFSSSGLLHLVSLGAIMPSVLISLPAPSLPCSLFRCAPLSINSCLFSPCLVSPALRICAACVCWCVLTGRVLTLSQTLLPHRQEGGDVSSSPLITSSPCKHSQGHAHARENTPPWMHARRRLHVHTHTHALHHIFTHGLT